METKDVILQLRIQNKLSQDELASRLYVTRQAVSRWETGETIPNTETLKLLSKFFDVSINTLLGSPRKLICQCCGMPLDDSSISKEPDCLFIKIKFTRKNAIPEILRELHFDEVYTLKIVFLQIFCIKEVCGEDARLWLYPEYPDSGFPIYSTETTLHKRNLRRR